MVYIKNAYTLELNEKEIFELVKVLYYKALASSTIGYKSILADQSVCLHHGIMPRKVGIFELVQINIKFTDWFVKEKIPIKLLPKFKILFFAHVRTIYYIIKEIIK